MDVREYFKKKNGEPMDEKYEDLLTVKEVLDIAQECVNEALKQAKNNESLHLVSHTVIYDNFGRDWREPKEKYQIMEVLKDGYLIGNEDTKPFFAYAYQIKTCG